MVLGVRLLHRTSRAVTPTTAGHTRLRIGHAWSALGRHTLEFQRRWAARYPTSSCS